MAAPNGVNGAAKRTVWSRYSYRKVIAFVTIVTALTFPDLTRHFFSSLAETVDGCSIVVLNRWTQSKNLC